MKPLTLILAALLTHLVPGLRAGPLQNEHIAADVKWLIHVDLENFLTTELGEFVGRELIDAKLAKPARDLQKQFGLELDWRKVRGLTAYGTDYQGRGEAGGVLLIHSQIDLAQALDTAMAKFAALAGGSEPLKKLQTEPFPIYAFKSDAFATPLPGNLFLLSRSQKELENARQVIKGKAANLAATKTFSAFPSAAPGFFLMGVAEGFSKAPLPPQAQVLKRAEGGQLIAGEKAGKLFLDLALSTQDKEAAAQIQQVLQGLLALAALSQDKNKDLQQLTQNIKIGGMEKLVTVNLELPVAAVMSRLTEERQKRDK